MNKAENIEVSGVPDIRRALDGFDLPLGMADAAGRLVHVNAALAAMLNLSPTDAAGMLLADLLPAADFAEFMDRLRSDAAKRVSVATMLRRPAGELPVYLCWVPTVAGAPAIFSVQPMADAEHVFAARDRALLEYRAIMADAPVGVAFSRNRRIVRYNDEFARLFGFTGNSGIGQPTRIVYPSEEAYEDVSRRAFPLLSAGFPFSEEVLLRRQDGSTFWGSAVGYLVDPKDPPLGTIWIISDISARKATEARLQATLLEWEAIFDNASVGITYTKDRIFQRCNVRAEAMLGYAPGEMQGLPGIAIYPSQESYGRIGMEAGPLLAAGQAFESDWQYKRKDGSLVWCHVYAKAVDPERNERGTVWVLEDTSAARATQEQLRAALRDYQSILDYASVGIIYTSERKIQRYNPKFAEMFGFAGDGAVGLPARVLYRSDEEYAELGRVAVPLLSQGKSFQQELYMRNRDGSDFWVNLIGYVADPDNPAWGTWWILEDRSAFKCTEEALQRNFAELKTTHRKLEEAQAQLLQSEKMASIGQLAAGVAHEINNPIGFVNSNVGTLGLYINQLLELVAVYERGVAHVALPAEVEKDIAAAREKAEIGYLREDIGALLKESREGLERVRRIVKDLKDFSHVDEDEWQPADLNAGIQSTLNVVWNELKYKAKVVHELGELPSVYCNPAQINQVLMNLLVNAAQAIERQGQITVRSGAEGEWVWLEVDDDGCGIPADVQVRIFDPFFTTKPVGKGTGLGLSVSYGIVNKHGGRFEMESKPGKGTRLRFWLPVDGPGEFA